MTTELTSFPHSFTADPNSSQPGVQDWVRRVLERWDCSFGNSKSLEFISKTESVYANVSSVPAFQSIFHALMQFKWTVTTLNFFEIVQSQTHDST